MIRSLRVQMLLGMAASILLMFAFSTLALHFVLRYHIYNQYFEDLRDRARTLAMYVEFERGRLSFEWAHYDLNSTMQPDPDDGIGCLFKIWKAPQQVLAQTNIFPHLDLPPRYEAPEQPILEPITLPDGTSAYMISFRFHAIHEDEEPILDPVPQLGITVVRRTISVDSTMFWLDITLLGVATATMMISTLGILLLIHWGLKPLTPVLTQLKEIGAGDLSRRVEAGKLPRELVSIIRTVNDLLAALEIKVERERRFVANAAHELRNPITAVRANLEVSLFNSDDEELRLETQRSSLEAAIQLQHVCERLLSLAGLQQENIALELQNVDIPELVASIQEDLEDEAAKRGIVFAWSMRDKAAILTDPVLLNVIISNLLRNAVSYAQPDKAVELSCTVNANGARLTVRNAVMADQELDAQKVMEPFWRGDQPRTLGEGHLGLGLTIAKTAAEQLRGQLGCELQDQGKTFVAIVTLPREWAGARQSSVKS